MQIGDITLMWVQYSTPTGKHENEAIGKMCNKRQIMSL